jgi:UDP-glucose 4-epimerase
MVLNKIGLTGATGMLGRHLRAALEHDGATVVEISRSPEEGSACFKWDLVNWLTNDELDALFSGVQAVIHAGAVVPSRSDISRDKLFDANVRACANLSDWALAKNVPVVFISGAIVYEDVTAIDVKEESQLGWNELGGYYGFSKLLGEDVFTRFQRRGLKRAVVRPTSIYGHGLPATKLISRFLAIAEVGGVIALNPPYGDRVDFIHAADVSQAVLTIIKLERWEIFNLSSGRPTSVLELAEECTALTQHGTVATSQHLFDASPPTTRFALNTDKAKRSLNWCPSINIKEGIKMMRDETLLFVKPLTQEAP